MVEFCKIKKYKHAVRALGCNVKAGKKKTVSIANSLEDPD